MKTCPAIYTDGRIGKEWYHFIEFIEVAQLAIQKVHRELKGNKKVRHLYHPLLKPRPYDMTLWMLKNIQEYRGGPEHWFTIDLKKAGKGHGHLGKFEKLFVSKSICDDLLKLLRAGVYELRVDGSLRQAWDINDQSIDIRKVIGQKPAAP